MSDETETTARIIPKVIAAIAATPWAITEAMLDTIVTIAQRQNDVTPQALEAYRAKRISDTESLSIRNGVGIIRVAGPMFRYADLFSAISGGSTYDGIRSDLQRAVDEPGIRAILLTFDSPGGQVNGVSELAAAIRDAAAVKPVEAYVSNDANSAAYWLASAAQRITVSETATLGSIGVRMGMTDTSEQDAKRGIKRIEFVSSQSPDKVPDVSTSEGRAKVQKIVDSLANVFVSRVAGYRAVSKDTVVNRFGRGGIEIGAQAVKLGMADEIGSFESTLSRLSRLNAASRLRAAS